MTQKASQRQWHLRSHLQAGCALCHKEDTWHSRLGQARSEEKAWGHVGVVTPLLPEGIHSTGKIENILKSKRVYSRIF